MKRISYSLVIFLSAVMLAAGVSAAEDETLTGVLEPNFKFQHQHLSSGKSYARDEMFTGNNLFNNQNMLFADKGSAFTGDINQYDATISYPVSSSAVNFDLGINLRYVDAELTSQSTDRASTHINTTLPMFYANAFFNLPFKGMSASIGGSHLQYDDYLAFNYKAKLSYTWENGFGLEGGWQHQRFNVDSNDVQADFESKGPFLDLKYHF